MKFNDSRSFKVAIVADYFVNPQSYPSLPKTDRVYATLRDAGYGIIKMPPQGISEATASAWVTSTVDQIQEYTHRGFKVAILGMEDLPQAGLWLDSVTKELGSRGVPTPPTKIMTIRDVADASHILGSFLPP